MAKSGNEGSFFDQAHQSAVYAHFERLGDEAVRKQLMRSDINDVEAQLRREWLGHKGRRDSPKARLQWLAVFTIVAFVVCLVALAVFDQ